MYALLLDEAPLDPDIDFPVTMPRAKWRTQVDAALLAPFEGGDSVQPETFEPDPAEIERNQQDDFWAGYTVREVPQ